MLDQHAGHVERHVAVADYGNLARVQRPGARHVRVGVIPVDEIGGTVRAVEVDARNVQVSILDCTGRENHCVVVLFQVFEGDVGAVFHVAEEANVAAVENLV